MTAACRRVLITGIGLLTPLGSDRETTWSGLVAGRSATGWLPPWERTDAPSSRSPSLGDVQLPRLPGATVPASSWSVLTDPDVHHRDLVVRLAVQAAEEAWQDAGLAGLMIDPQRLGCVIGTSKGGVRSFGIQYALSSGRLAPSTPADIRRDVWSDCFPDAAARAVARMLGADGPVLCPVAACATGLISLIRGAGLIQDGMCDVVIAGSSDASLEPTVLASFLRMGVLARGMDDPASACRPMDQRRCGFVVGEGAGIVVLESLEHAQRRQARAYAEWRHGAMLGSASGLIRLGGDAAPLQRLLCDVLTRSGVEGPQIDSVSLHGTATRENDPYECVALRSVLGPSSRASCSSLKGSIGHLLGAAGSVETAVAALSLSRGIVPPTVNLHQIDPACRLPDLPTSARHRPLQHVLKLSLGFGGHLAAAVMSQPLEDVRRTSLTQS